MDIKRKYTSLLCDELQNDESLIQILNNLIGSNKDNTTHLVRNPRVFCFFCPITKDKKITVTESEKKPYPLPKALKRSRSGKFYSQYSLIGNDSIIETYIKETENISLENDDYSAVDFSNIKKNEVDYLEK